MNVMLMRTTSTQVQKAHARRKKKRSLCYSSTRMSFRHNPKTSSSNRDLSAREFQFTMVTTFVTQNLCRRSSKALLLNTTSRNSRTRIWVPSSTTQSLTSATSCLIPRRTCVCTNTNDCWWTKTQRKNVVVQRMRIIYVTWSPFWCTIRGDTWKT